MRFEDAEPILKAVYQLLEGNESTRPDAVCAALGRAPSDEDTLRALALLYEDGYIAGITIEQAADPVLIEGTALGRQYASGWPSQDTRVGVALLLQLLDERINRAPEPARADLQRVKVAVQEARPEIVDELLSAYKNSA